MRLEPGWLDALVARAEEDTSIAAVASKLRLYSAPEKLNGVGGAMNYIGLHLGSGNVRDWTAVNMTGRNDVLFASAGAALFRRALFLECGGFDERFFMYHEDVDLCWRFLDSGLPGGHRTGRRGTPSFRRLHPASTRARVAGTHRRAEQHARAPEELRSEEPRPGLVAAPDAAPTFQEKSRPAQEFRLEPLLPSRDPWPQTQDPARAKAQRRGFAAPYCTIPPCPYPSLMSR